MSSSPKMIKKPKKRNPIAKALRDPAFHKRVVENKKYAYTRKVKHKKVLDYS